MKINKITVGDNGDPSVGIGSAFWEIDMRGAEIEEENLNTLRKDLRNLYSEWSDMGCDYCEFDFETEVEPPDDSNDLIEKQVAAYSSGFTAGRDSEMAMEAQR